MQLLAQRGSSSSGIALLMLNVGARWSACWIPCIGCLMCGKVSLCPW